MNRNEKQEWCVYGKMWLWGYGRVTGESKNGSTLWVQYSEGQTYPPCAWDAQHVTRFDTLREAANYYYEHSLDPYQSVEKDMRQQFPTQAKEELGVMKCILCREAESLKGHVVCENCKKAIDDTLHFPLDPDKCG
jgi:hypothetical protein